MLYIINGKYDVLFAIDDNNNLWRRTGQCKQCGKCCVALHPENYGENGMCKYLNDNKCSLEAVKPIHCRMSPVSPDIHNHIPDCGYKWEEAYITLKTKKLFINEVIK